MKRTRLKPRSERRMAEDAEWEAVREFVDGRDLSRCQAPVRLRSSAAVTSAECLCSGPHHPHHIWPTGELGPRLDPDNVITLCARHHAYVHAHRDIAGPLGLILRENPRT